MNAGAWAIVIALLVGVGVVFEGWRQARKLGPSQGRPDLMGVGALELQRLLQPDRKVEIVQRQLQQEEIVDPGYRPGAGGDDPDLSARAARGARPGGAG